MILQNVCGRHNVLEVNCNWFSALKEYNLQIFFIAFIIFIFLLQDVTHLYCYGLMVIPFMLIPIMLLLFGNLHAYNNFNFTNFKTI